jgi:hypothetical protein
MVSMAFSLTPGGLLFQTRLYQKDTFKHFISKFRHFASHRKKVSQFSKFDLEPLPSEK